MRLAAAAKYASFHAHRVAGLTAERSNFNLRASLLSEIDNLRTAIWLSKERACAAFEKDAHAGDAFC